MLINIVIIIMLTIVIFQLGRLIVFVKNHYQELSIDPFIFGAKKYEVDYCLCFYPESENTIFFNQSVNILRIKQKSSIVNTGLNYP